MEDLNLAAMDETHARSRTFNHPASCYNRPSTECKHYALALERKVPAAQKR